MIDEKPRLVHVTDAEERRYLLQHFGDIDVPPIFFEREDGAIMAYAHQLREWRATRTSGEAK
jgi:hypothetical protein